MVDFETQNAVFSTENENFERKNGSLRAKIGTFLTKWVIFDRKCTFSCENPFENL